MVLCRLFATLLVLLPFCPAAAAGGGFADGLRYVFVTHQDSAVITVIDSRDDSIAGSVDAGLVPSQLESAGELGRLVAIDGVNARVAVLSLVSGAATLVALDFVPTRLQISADGARAVAAAPADGRIAVLDVAAARVVGQGNVAPFRDLLLIGDGPKLMLGGEVLTLLEVPTLRVVAELGAGLGGFTTLSRSPNGRLVYARAAAAPVVVAVDVRAAQVVGEVAAGQGIGKAYTNATGITLILPDSTQRSVALLPSSLKGGGKVTGEAGMTAVYSGWFDTVAFIPSTKTKALVVIDQQGQERGDDIALGGVAGRGTVTPDGRKLYLPLTDGKSVAIIDAEHRRLKGKVAMPARPAMALMARTFGICH